MFSAQRIRFQQAGPHSYEAKILPVSWLLQSFRTFLNKALFCLLAGMWSKLSDVLKDRCLSIERPETDLAPALPLLRCLSQEAADLLNIPIFKQQACKIDPFIKIQKSPPCLSASLSVILIHISHSDNAPKFYLLGEGGRRRGGGGVGLRRTRLKQPASLRSSWWPIILKGHQTRSKIHQTPGDIGFKSSREIQKELSTQMSRPWFFQRKACLSLSAHAGSSKCLPPIGGVTRLDCLQSTHVVPTSICIIKRFLWNLDN